MTRARSLSDIFQVDIGLSPAEKTRALLNLGAASIENAGVPVGRISMRFGPLDPGHLAWGEGGTFNRATHPLLAIWLDTNGAALGLSPAQIAAGTIPNWVDHGPRTAGNKIAVGALQGFALQGHKHEADRQYTAAANTNGGDGGFVQKQSGGYYLQMKEPLTLAPYGAVQIADETRGMGFGVRWQINAFGAPAEQDMVVISALAASVQALESKAVRSDVVQTFTILEKKRVGKNSGAIIFEGSITPGASQLVIPLGDANGYAGVILRLVKVKPSVENVGLNMRVKAPGNAQFDVTGYQYDYARIDSGSWAFVGSTSNAQLEVISPVWAGVAGGVSGTIEFMDHEATTQFPTFNIHMGAMQAGGANMRHYIGGGARSAAQATSELLLYFSNGNFASGRYQLYGIL